MNSSVDTSQAIENQDLRDTALADAVREHGGAMLSVARRLLGNEEDARECVQEGYLRAFSKAESFEGRSSFRTWLHRIVVNTALGILRSRKRAPTQSIDDLLPEFDAEGCRIEPDWHFNEPLERMLERDDVRSLVRRSIDGLPDPYRTVLLLRDIEGFTTDEAAAMLETNTGAIKTRLHRARAALKKQLEPLWARGEL